MRRLAYKAALVAVRRRVARRPNGARRGGLTQSRLRRNSMRVTRMPASRVIRAAMFYAFAQELRLIGDDVPADVLQEVVSDAIDHFGVEPNEIAEQFRCGRATVSRWKSGESVPVPYMRRSIVIWLADRMEREAMANEELASSRVVELYSAAQRQQAQ